MKKQKGITLVALVITIIVLLILAGVTINLVLGDNGVLNRAKTSAEEYQKASIKEEIELAIADIAAELASKNPTESLTKEAIVNNLPDRMQEPLAIEDDLSGEYKGYEYWIDDNDVVHIGDKVNSNFKVSIKKDKIGTSYFTVSVNATSNQGVITEYCYVVDGIEQTPIDKATYTVEGLEEKSEHTIKVIVKDDKGNTKTSRTLTIVTEPKLYLFKDGVDNTELTGGWEAIAKAAKNNAVPIIPTLSIDTNINAYVTQPSTGSIGGSVLTKNKINMENYRYIGVRYTANLGRYNSASSIASAYENGAYIDMIEFLCYTNGAVNNLTYKIDIRGIDTENRLGIYLQSFVKEGTSSVQIHEMWLEK